MHPAKRRRLESTQITLNKPFRSPLRTTGTRTALSDGSDISIRGATLSIKPALAPHHASPAKASNSSLASLPDEGQNQNAVLARKLAKLRQSLDIAEQALQIVASCQDDQLEALTAKWKSVARDAADDLFVETKARIDDMGGLESWKRQVQNDKLLWAEDGRHAHHASSSQNSLMESDEDDTSSVESEPSQSQEPIVHQVSSLPYTPFCAH